MKVPYLYKLFIILSLLPVFFSSCNGQVSTIFEAHVNESKIIKTQGTDQYQPIGCSLQDKAGNLWFGTAGEGVYRYDGKSFSNFTEKDGLNSNNVSYILEDKSGNIWFGTNAGLCRYDGKIFTPIPVFINSGSNFSTFSGKTAAGSPVVRCMLQDKKGDIWFGTQNDGVYRYDGTSFIRFLHQDGVGNKDSLRLNAVTSILEDKSGNIWFSTWFEGICCYNGTSISSFKPNGEAWYAAIFEDRNGNIWAGRRTNGVCRYDGKTFTNVVQHGILDSCCVMAITEDQQGNIWLGTEAADMTKRNTQGGLWCYNGKTFRNFTKKDGLGNYSVFSILLDSAGNIWAGTRNTGLYRYDGKTFTSFSE